MRSRVIEPFWVLFFQICYKLYKKLYLYSDSFQDFVMTFFPF